MLTRRFGDSNTMANIRLEQHGLVREQSGFLKLRNGQLELVDRKSKNVSCQSIMADDHRRNVRFASSWKIRSEFLLHLGDLFCQHLKARERQIIRDVRHHTAIG